MEKRVLQFGGELRAQKSGKGMQVGGYAARYNVLSNPLPLGKTGKTFRERIASRAFDSVLKDPKLDTVMTFNHSLDAVLGRTTSGTLRLRGDGNGLGFECDLPDTQLGRDTYELVKRGDLPGMSFAFELGDRSDEQEWEEEEIEDEKDLGLRGRVRNAIRTAVRTIKSFRKLHDVSIVTMPAYPGTQVDARNVVGAALGFGKRIGATDIVAPLVLPATSRSAKAQQFGVYSGDDARDLWARQDMLKAILED